jgi:hypothetical protein
MKKYILFSKNVFVLFFIAASFAHSSSEEDMQRLFSQKLENLITARSCFVCAQRNFDVGNNDECRENFMSGIGHLQRVGLGVFGDLLNYCYAAMNDEQGLQYSTNWFPAQTRKQSEDTVTINLPDQRMDAVRFLALLNALFPSYEEKKSFTCQIIKDFVANTDAVEDHVRLIDFLTNDPLKVQDEPFWRRSEKNKHLYLPDFSEELLALIFNHIDTNEIYKRNAAAIMLRDFENSTFIFSDHQKTVIKARVKKYAEKLAQNGPIYMKIFYANHFVDKAGRNSFPKMRIDFHSAATAEVTDFHLYCDCGATEADLEKAIASGDHMEFGSAFYPSLFGKIVCPNSDANPEEHKAFSKQIKENSGIYQQRLRNGYKKIIDVLENSTRDGRFDDLIICLKKELVDQKTEQGVSSFGQKFLACKHDVLTEFSAFFTKISDDSEEEITESEKSNLIDWFGKHKIIVCEMKFEQPGNDWTDEVEEVGSYNHYFSQAIQQIISENDPNALQYYHALSYSGFSSGGFFDFGKPFEKPALFKFSTQPYDLNIKKHKRALEVYFKSLNMPYPYIVTPTEENINDFPCLQACHRDMLDIPEGSHTLFEMIGNFQSTPATIEYGDGLFFSGRAQRIEREEISVNGLIGTLEFVHIKAKKFTFKKNALIDARKGTIIEAEEFVLEGGGVAYPHLCHLIRVPKGSLTLNVQSSL